MIDKSVVKKTCYKEMMNDKECVSVTNSLILVLMVESGFHFSFDG